MTPEEIYTAGRFIEREMNKKILKHITTAKILKILDPSLPFASKVIPKAILEGNLNYPKFNKTEIDYCQPLSTAINNGLINYTTLIVYMFGIYIHSFGGKVFRRNRDGSFKLKKGECLSNRYPFSRIKNLDFSRLYKPESLNDQYRTAKRYKHENGSEMGLTELDERQENLAWRLVCDGKMGYHLYLHLFKINEGFNIDLSKTNTEYAKLIKLTQDLLNNIDINLLDIFFFDSCMKNN